jgi:hypothetical protein
VTGTIIATTGLGASLSLNSFAINGTGSIGINGGITGTTLSATSGLGQNLSLNTYDITGTGNINISGNISATALGASLSLGTFNLTGSGNVSTSGQFITSNATPSSSTTSGALQVAGGAGIAGALNVGGLAQMSSINLNQNLTSGGLFITTNSGASTAYDLFSISASTADTLAPQALFNRTRGTNASPAPVVTGDNLFNLLWTARSTNGTTAQVGAIGANATGTIGNGIVPGQVFIATANSAGVIAPKLTIDTDGKQIIVAPSLVAGASSGQVNTATISTWMKVSFNGVDYAVPMYQIRP